MNKISFIWLSMKNGHFGQNLFRKYVPWKLKVRCLKLFSGFLYEMLMNCSNKFVKCGELKYQTLDKHLKEKPSWEKVVKTCRIFCLFIKTCHLANLRHHKMVKISSVEPKYVSREKTKCLVITHKQLEIIWRNYKVHIKMNSRKTCEFDLLVLNFCLLYFHEVFSWQRLARSRVIASLL